MKRAVLAIVLATAPLLADVVHLRGGGRLTGEIVEQTADSVTVDIGAGKMTVQMSTVVSIDKSTSPLQEYRARAATTADSDVEGWRELGRWAMKEGLGAQAREAFSRVHTALPNDPEANRALGLVLYEGRWVSEEESYRARGFVNFEGEWMTPAESQAILAERNTREEANRQAVAAEVKASEAALREREAQEEAQEAEEAARRHGNLPVLGDPVWGYGYVPTVWPTQPVTSGGGSR